MLEAKDQEHQRKCSPKKKFHKNFSSDLHKKRFPKNFSSAPLIFQQFKKYCCPRAEDRPIFEHVRPRGQGQGPVADLENFGGGDNKNFKHTTSKIRMSSPKLSDFSAEIGNSNVFSAQNQVVSKTKKKTKKGLHRN